MIKIIKGIYGHYSGNRVVPKSCKDEPFELDKEKEKALVEQGVAVYVGKEEEKTESDAPDLDELTVNQLKDYAASEGIDIGNAKKKADILKIIYEATEAPVLDAVIPE